MVLVMLFMLLLVEELASSGQATIVILVPVPTGYKIRELQEWPALEYP